MNQSYYQSDYLFIYFMKLKCHNREYPEDDSRMSPYMRGDAKLQPY